MGLSHLETRYLDSCRRQQMLPNSSILSSFSKAILQKSSQEKCSLEISLDQLVPSDFPPLIDAFLATNLYGIDAVDVRQESPGVLFPGEYVLSLFRAINQKLRVVDLFYCSFWKDILRVISISGMTCQVLNMRSSPIRRLNMSGNFMQLHTLNLDFSISLSSFWESCFSCMPNLLRLSMCETRIANLWMTSAALSKLPSLVELRFQNCSCCHDTGPCPTLSSGKAIAFDYEKIHSGLQHFYTYYGPPLASESFMRQQMHHSGTEDYNVFSDDEPFTNHELPQNSTEESSDESELDFLSSQQGTSNRSERLSDAPPELDLPDNLEIVLNQTGYYASVSSGSSVPTIFNHVEEDFCSRSINNIYEMNTVEDLHNNYQNGLAAVDELFDPLELDNQFSAGTPLTRVEQGCSADGLNEESDHALRSSDLAPKRRISHHPSPICFEKHYREYMITSLPRLKVLDNLPVKNMERDKAKIIFKQYYEYLPYSRQHKESVVSILQKREIGTSTILQKSSYLRQPCSSRQCNHSFSRSLSAAKVSSCPWPRLHTVSKFRSISREEIKSFRPRQFEYHPSNPSLMVFGTLDGELIVINHESGKLVGYLPSVGALHSILGLCWLKNHPSKLIAGSDNGSLQLYDVCQMPSTLTDRYYSMDAATFSFDEFEQLTSVHVNSTDELLLASGFSKHVALYDIGSARRLQVFENLHREHINVVKFSHHSPSVFATASFDQEVKMWDLRQGTSQPCYTACSSRGNVMVCFSPDDHYLLSSAVDNEVKQLLAVDGRLHMEFNIASTGSAQNYTRSYYMNGRDYIISGSCEENVVRICCAQTGRRLRDISLEGRGSRKSMFVQSLRGDPFRVFHMSVLAAYLRPSSKSEIIKVNLLANGDCIENDSCVQHWRPSYCMGG